MGPEVAERADRFLFAGLGRIDHAAVDAVLRGDNGTLISVWGEGGIGRACGQRHAGRAQKRLLRRMEDSAFDSHRLINESVVGAVNAAERDSIERLSHFEASPAHRASGKDRNPLFLPRETAAGGGGASR